MKMIGTFVVAKIFVPKTWVSATCLSFRTHSESLEKHPSLFKNADTPPEE
jgi:hypothetical protein